VLHLDAEDRHKIKVEIKPYSPSETVPSNNVDDIKKSIEGLRLSPSTVVSIIALTLFKYVEESSIFTDIYTLMKLIFSSSSGR